MATKISPELRREIEQVGYAKTGDIGGQPKTRYWTPDGREIWSAPSWHEYTQRDKAGKVIASGVRDANLDKGWLLEKPSKLKLYCSSCDLWHDSQMQINKCHQKRQIFIRQVTKTALKSQNETEGNGRLAKLETKMAEMKAMIKKLVEAK